MQPYLHFTNRKNIFLFGSLLVLLLFAGSLFAQTMRNESGGYRKLPVKPGEKCLVCNMRLDAAHGFAIIFRGRRVPLDELHLPVFLNNPEKYFYKLQPTSALFDENAITTSGASYWALGIGTWIVLALVSAAFCCVLALRKGFPAKRWFLLGLAGNFFAVLFLWSQHARQQTKLPPGMAKIPRTAAPIRCPGCGSPNHPSADHCLQCGLKLTPVSESEVARAV